MYSNVGVIKASVMSALQLRLAPGLLGIVRRWTTSSHKSMGREDIPLKLCEVVCMQIRLLVCGDPPSCDKRRSDQCETVAACVVGLLRHYRSVFSQDSQIQCHCPR
jgi:hypothetical protein